MEPNDILHNNQPKEPLPNATIALVLGILSLVFCFIYGVPGLIIGIVGLVLANKDRKLYNLNPSQYTPNSFTNSNAGRVCSLIGIILSSIYVIIILIIIMVIGTNADFLEAIKGMK